MNVMSTFGEQLMCFSSTEEINGRKNEPQPLIAVWLSNRSLEK